MQPSSRVSLSADHEVRLETLEHQLMRLIHNTVSWVWLMFPRLNSISTVIATFDYRPGQVREKSSTPLERAP